MRVAAGFANPMTAVGDLIVGGTSGAATRYPAGSNGQILSLVGGSIDWVDAADVVAAFTEDFYVSDYGAVFDGSSDDKAEIQAAIDAANAAGGGRVILLRGTAKLSGKLTFYSNVHMIGPGRNVCILQTTATSGVLPDGAMLSDGGVDVNSITLKGFKVLGHGEDETSGDGIQFYGTGVRSNLVFDDLDVTGFPGYCIKINDPILSSFTNLFLQNAGVDNFYVNLGTSCLFSSIYFIGGDKSGLHLQSHTYSVVQNCAAEYCTSGYWMHNSNNIHLIGCGGEVQGDFDSAGTTGGVSHYRIDGASHITISSCYSTKFAYLHGVNAQHLYITGSDHIIIQNFRGRAPVPGTGDPGEAPTYTINIISSEVIGINVEFEAELGGGQNGSFKYELTSVGGLNINTTNGIDFNPGSDTSFDMLTVGVTDTPKLTWSEGNDRFEMSKGLAVTGSLTGTTQVLTPLLRPVSNDTTLVIQSRSFTASSGTQITTQIAPVINGSGTQGYTALEVDVTETATGSGTKNLMNLQVGNVDKFTVNNAGTLTKGNVDSGVSRIIQIQVSDPNGSAITTGDGKAYFRINSVLNGYDLTAVAAHVTTVSSSGTPTIQIANVTQAVDMLSTKITIDANENDSATAETPAVIDTNNDDVATGDEIRIDIDVAGTGAKGLIVELTFTKP